MSSEDCTKNELGSEDLERGDWIQGTLVVQSKFYLDRGCLFLFSVRNHKYFLTQMVRRKKNTLILVDRQFTDNKK